MPTKIQIIKNLKLSEKLLNYLSENPRENKENVSYIVITKNDSALNKANLSIAESIAKKGKKVVKAFETNNKLSPWKFSSI